MVFLFSGSCFFQWCVFPPNGRKALVSSLFTSLRPPCCSTYLMGMWALPWLIVSYPRAVRQKFLILSLLCVAPDKTSSVCVVVRQLCPILCDPIFGSLSDSSVHGILQARIPEWVAISFSTVLSKYLINELFGKLAHIYEDCLFDACIFRVTSCCFFLIRRASRFKNNYWTCLWPTVFWFGTGFLLSDRQSVTVYWLSLSEAKALTSCRLPSVSIW